MPRVAFRPLAIALAAALASAVAACGSGDSAAVSDGRPVTIAMSEFRLSPQELELSPGVRTLVVANEGTMVHRFELRSADGERRLARGRFLRPGASDRIALDLPPGEYLIRCEQERHDTLGERGTLRVRRPPRPAAARPGGGGAVAPGRSAAVGGERG